MGRSGASDHSPLTRDRGGFEYDAFISYSRSDSRVASDLQGALTRYRPPRQIDPSRQPLRVFLDAGDLTGSAYYEAIEQNIGASRKMIVLCSPEARASAFVSDEVARFVRSRGAENLIPLLVRGKPNSEAELQAEAAFPETLCDVISHPLAVDYRGFEPGRDNVSRGEFYSPWYTLLANLLDVSRREVEGRARAQRRRAMAMTLASLVSLAAILSVFAGIAWWQRRLAIERETDAVALALLQSATTSHREGAIDRGLLLGIEAFRTRDNLRTRDTLLQLLQDTRPDLIGYVHSATGILDAIPLQGAGERLLLLERGSRVSVWSPKTLTRLKTLRLPEAFASAQLRFASERDLVGLMRDGNPRVFELWNLASGKELVEFDVGSAAGFAFSPDASVVAFADENGRIQLRSLNNGVEVPDLAPAYEEVGLIGLGDIEFSPDGRWLAITDEWGWLHAWDMLQPEVPPKAYFHESRSVPAIGFWPRHDLIAESGESEGWLAVTVTGKSAKVWDPTVDPGDGDLGLVREPLRPPDALYVKGWSLGEAWGSPAVAWSTAAGVVVQTPRAPTKEITDEIDQGLITDEIDHPFTDEIDQARRAHARESPWITFGRAGGWLATYNDVSAAIWDVSAETLGPPGHRGTNALLSHEVVVEFETDRHFFSSNELPLLGRKERQPEPATFATSTHRLNVEIRNNALTFWDSAGDVPPLALQFDSSANGLLFSRYDHKVAIWSGREVILVEPVDGADRHIEVSRIELLDAAEGPKSWLIGGSFAPDRSTLALWTNGKVFFVDTAPSADETGVRVAHASSTRDVVWDSSGSVAVAVGGHTISIFDLQHLRTGSERQNEPTRRVRYSADFGVRAATVSPNGTTLAVLGDDASVALFDLRTGTAIGGPIRWPGGWRYQNSIVMGAVQVAIEFDATGERVQWGERLGDDEWSANTLDASPRLWIEHACRIANRNLSEEEWRRFGLGRSIRETCRQPKHVGQATGR